MDPGRSTVARIELSRFDAWTLHLGLHPFDHLGAHISIPEWVGCAGAAASTPVFHAILALLLGSSVPVPKGRKCEYNPISRERTQQPSTNNPFSSMGCTLDRPMIPLGSIWA